MKRQLSVLLFLSICLVQAFPQTGKPSKTADTVPLDKVIDEVQKALGEYQDNLGSGAADKLPPLSSAEFDFKTTTATTVGVTVNLFIFKFGTSHEKDTVNDVTYTYSVPPPKGHGAELESNQPPKSFKDELLQTIQAAAKAVKGSATAGNLPFSKLTVNLQYGIKWDVNAGVNAPIQFVTLGVSGDKNKNTVQSVKLVFGQ
jgi:hypothetical protein